MKLRNGKIARLLKKTREELNARMLKGESTPSLLAWLNGSEEVREQLKHWFDGGPITKQNISQWRRGGFREWELKYEMLWDLNDYAVASHEMENQTNGWMAECLSRVVAAKYLLSLKEWDGNAEGPVAERIKLLSRMCRDVALMRRGDRDQMRIDREFSKEDRERKAKEEASSRSVEQRWYGAFGVDEAELERRRKHMGEFEEWARLKAEKLREEFRGEKAEGKRLKAEVLVEGGLDAAREKEELGIKKEEILAGNGLEASHPVRVIDANDLKGEAARDEAVVQELRAELAAENGVRASQCVAPSPSGGEIPNSKGPSSNEIPNANIQAKPQSGLDSGKVLRTADGEVSSVKCQVSSGNGGAGATITNESANTTGVSQGQKGVSGPKRGRLEDGEVRRWGGVKYHRIGEEIHVTFSDGSVKKYPRVMFTPAEVEAHRIRKQKLKEDMDRICREARGPAPKRLTVEEEMELKRQEQLKAGPPYYHTQAVFEKARMRWGR